MTDIPAPETLCQMLLDKARAAGADTADVMFMRAEAMSHSQRLGEIDMLEREESTDLGLRVFVGKRQAVVSTTDLAPATLDELAERAVAMARAVPADDFCGIADPDQVTHDFPRIETADPEEPAPEVLIERARAAEEAALAVSGVTNSDGATANWSRHAGWIAASNGFSGSHLATSHAVGVSVIAGKDLAMETDYDHSQAVFGADLEDPAAVGRSAGERAVRRLGAKRVKTARVPVVFDQRVARSMVGHFLGAINGSSVARGTSFLKDRMGEAIFGSGITIREDPLKPRGLRSLPFDDEGIATVKRDLIDDGVLTSWLLDLRSSRQLGLAPTGHGHRSPSAPPSPGSTNVWLEAGSQSPEEMIAEIESGLFITSMIGQGVNMITGDYSRGASGFWIEKGELAYPVNELTVAGNLRDMFKALTPANDLTFKYAVNAPTLRVDGMTVAGA